MPLLLVLELELVLQLDLLLDLELLALLSLLLVLDLLILLLEVPYIYLPLLVVVLGQLRLLLGDLEHLDLLLPLPMLLKLPLRLGLKLLLSLLLDLLTLVLDRLMLVGMPVSECCWEGRDVGNKKRHISYIMCELTYIFIRITGNTLFNNLHGSRTQGAYGFHKTLSTFFIK